MWPPSDVLPQRLNSIIRFLALCKLICLLAYLLNNNNNSYVDDNNDDDGDDDNVEKRERCTKKMNAGNDELRKPKLTKTLQMR